MLAKVKSKKNGRCYKGSRHVSGRSGCWKKKGHSMSGSKKGGRMSGSKKGGRMSGKKRK